MVSNTLVDTSIVIDYSVFEEELPMLSPHAQDVYGCLLNNGLYVFQPNCKMDVKLIENVLGCYYGTVRSMYLQSPQVAYVDICLGKELTSPGFYQFFLSGIHRASFPDTPLETILLKLASTVLVLEEHHTFVNCFMARYFVAIEILKK